MKKIKEKNKSISFKKVDYYREQQWFMLIKHNTQGINYVLKYCLIL